MFRLSRSGAHQFLLLLLTSSTSASPINIWHVSIFEGPAPSPEDGPPLSASSLRDPSYLPIQIGSIVAAYIFFVIVIGLALLLVGRRLRRAAQASPRTLAMEIMRPFQSDSPKSYDPSPITLATNNPYGPSPNSTIDMKGSWPSPDKSRTTHNWPSFGKSHHKQTSMQSSVVTFDESVIEEDKSKNQQEMDRLYAAVMEHDEQRSTSKLDLTAKNLPQDPPELQHLRSDSGAVQQVSSLPSRLDTKSPTRMVTASSRKQTRPSPITTVSRASSRSSIGSFGKKRGIRNLPISPPMGSPDLVSEHMSFYGESEPLSPRLYEPGPPPPTPPMRQHDSIPEDENHTSRLSPRRAGFPDFHRTPRTAAPTTQTFAEAPSRPQLQTGNSDSYIPLRDLTKQKRTPTPLALKTGTTANTSTQQLPLRSAPLPLRNPNPSGVTSTRPPSTIKATVLERSVPDHLRGPRTGVPSTPYSPYMPFTPLTPMTPSRLVTKQERKKREKEEGRRVATVEDAVIEESEMWGDGYP